MRTSVSFDGAVSLSSASGLTLLKVFTVKSLFKFKKGLCDLEGWWTKENSVIVRNDFYPSVYTESLLTWLEF